MNEAPRTVTASIFRAYDIRGKAGEELDESAAYSIGAALAATAREAGQTRIALGWDGRLSSPSLSQALAGGLCSGGMEVVEVGCVPTPALYFAAHELAGGNGAMVTGSHNPPEDNGIKLMLGGHALSGGEITAIHDRIRRDGPAAVAGGTRKSAAIAGPYLERIVRDITLERPLKVVVDGGNGTGGPLACELLRRLGCDVVALYCDIDGTFPNHHPDPSQPENLRALADRVVGEAADLGVAFDGDADRLGVVAPDGSPVWPDRLMILFARDVLSRHPGAEVIFDVKCSGNLPHAIEAAGGRPQMWRTGHSPIKKRMAESGSPLAGEMSGHLFFADRWYGFDDGLYAAARLLELLARDRRPVGEVFATLPDAVNTPELRVAMADGEAHRLMASLPGRSGRFAGARLSRVDGLRFDYPDRWCLIRASNTTASLVLRFEARDEAGLAALKREVAGLVREVAPGLNLPF